MLLIRQTSLCFKNELLQAKLVQQQASAHHRRLQVVVTDLGHLSHNSTPGAVCIWFLMWTLTYNTRRHQHRVKIIGTRTVVYDVQIIRSFISTYISTYCESVCVCQLKLYFKTDKTVMNLDRGELRIHRRCCSLLNCSTRLGRSHNTLYTERKG